MRKIGIKALAAILTIGLRSKTRIDWTLQITIFSTVVTLCLIALYVFQKWEICRRALDQSRSPHGRELDLTARAPVQRKAMMGSSRATGLDLLAFCPVLRSSMHFMLNHKLRSAHPLSGRSMRSSENSGGPSVSLRMRRSRSATGRDGSSNRPIYSTAKSSISTGSRRTAPRGSTDRVEFRPSSTS